MKQPSQRLAPRAWALVRQLLILCTALPLLGAGSVIAKTTTSTSLSSSINPSYAGQTTILTATVSPAAATGSITFKDGGTTLGSAPLSGGVATLSTSFTGTGAHSLSAAYGGSTTHATSTSASLSQSVKAVSSVALNAGPNPAVSGQPVMLMATVSPSSASGSVSFVEGGTTLGSATLTAGQASLTVASPAQGAHGISASYAGDATTMASNSGLLNLQVVIPVTLPAPPVSPAPVANYEYDAQGNPTKSIVAQGVSGFNFVTQSTYDTLSRRTDTTDAKNGVTRFGYDGLDRTTSIADPRNLVTQ